MKKIWIIIILAVLVLLGGVVWSRTLSSSDPEVVSANGIHWHPQVEVYIKGERQDIPNNLGSVGVHSPIHTHEDAPIVHMEIGGVVRGDDTSLSNFFRVWGKKFSSNRIFDYQNGSEGMVYMFVNGKKNTEFEKYHMQNGDRIEIRYE